MEVLVWVVEDLVRAIVAGSLELSKSSGKKSHIVSHSLSISFSIRLSLWLLWKEKVREVFVNQDFGRNLQE